jgi:nuclear pore complex protein Nup155
MTSSNDVVVAATLDSTKRIMTTHEKDGKKITTYVSPGGICEQLSEELYGVNGISGGRVWSIEPSSLAQNKIMTLTLHSKTPNDSELNYVVPPFTPATTSNTSATSSATPADGGSIVASAKSGTVASVGFGVMMNVLLGRPTTYGINVQKPIIQPLVKIPSYRISLHHGSDGFSMTAADVVPHLEAAAGTRSSRLSPWLLHPKAVSLEPVALQHLEPYESTFLAINVGGIHSYKSSSVLGRLRAAILAAGSNAPTDPLVDKFFQDYGLEEGCAMCFMLIVSQLSSHDLKQWSLHTAMRHSFNPKLVPSDDNEVTSYQQMAKNDPWIPTGYMLKPSHLCEGLYLAAARLLRPIWYKPAVVVTEGRVVKRGLKFITTAAKVELLLDNDVTDQVSQPLLELEDAVARFRKAIDGVPTKSVKNLIFFNAADADDLARHIEERNIHSLYRLLSRTTQLLSLLYHLRRADSMTDIPDVEWGLLHGLQFAQLVETSTGQERVESVLNKLVTSSATSSKGPSADANRLADILTQNCYYFFSSGNRNAFLGFQSAQEALGIPAGQSRRAVKAAEASDYLLKAAEFWYSPTLVTGQLLQTHDSEGFHEIAERAIRHSSPLAKACSCLVELGDVSSVVHICLATAANFSDKEKSLMETSDLPSAASLRTWEVGLYHKRQSSSSASATLSPGKTVPTGTNVTPKEAINTCYSMIFYYLSKFLDAPISSESYAMGEKMVSVCAFQSYTPFLHAFFEFMLNDNHKDVLLRLCSPELESWLVGKQNDDPDLLMKYFQIQNKRFKAGELARNHACDGHSKMKIFDRIEYLEIAVSSFSAAIAVGEIAPNYANIEQVKKETEGILNIAKLQSRTKQAMESTMYEVSDEALQRLEYSLLGASELLNTFAWPFDMFDICLLLFKACSHDDPVNTQLLWKSLISTNFVPCSTRNPVVFQKLENFVEGTNVENPKISLLDSTDSSDDPVFEVGFWVAKLEDSVVRLGQEIVGQGADFVFPVEFIAACLEGKLRAGCITQVFPDVGFLSRLCPMYASYFFQSFGQFLCWPLPTMMGHFVLNGPFLFCLLLGSHSKRPLTESTECWQPTSIVRLGCKTLGADWKTWKQLSPCLNPL